MNDSDLGLVARADGHRLPKERKGAGGCVLYWGVLRKALN